MVLGSAPYMAPEVALGRSADERSDVYSLGCVLYEMLTGRPPFIGDLPAAVMNQQTAAPPQPARELEPAIPARLDALLMQMLAKRAGDRPQRAADLVSALHTSLQQPPTAVTSPLPQVTPRPPTAVEYTHTSPPKRSSRRWWIALGAATVVLLAGLAVAFAAISGAGHRPSTAAPSRSTPIRSGTSRVGSNNHAAPPSKTRTSSTGAATNTTTAGTKSSGTTSNTRPGSATHP
jgi:serine/threonine-protein kinase